MTDVTIDDEKRAELAATLAGAIAEIEAAADERAIEAARVQWLGKSGKVSLLRKNIGKLPPAQKPLYGEAVNAVIAAVEAALTGRGGALAKAKLDAELSGPKLDVTLPGRAVVRGRRHPVSRTLDDMIAIFQRMGFQVASGPELELDFYNFEALAVPKDHPARDMQDTFYVDEAALPAGAVPPGELLLRTHTSPVQIRTMLGQRPPVRIIAPGRVYRCDSDQTHTPQFHQVEGLYVAERVTFAELKGTLSEFLRALFGPQVKTRFRPSFFPFTEPSAEFDMSCHGCGGSGRTAAGGCRLCKATGWIEIGGAGMVDPEVFRHVGYDPEVYAGFAFGLGVERMTMLRYGIDDLRTMFENDVRFLQQF